jgi:hypothetical protein
MHTITMNLSACFLMSNAKDRAQGIYREPAAELNFVNFATSLLAKVIAVAKAES